ncbi:MAG: hypothetical protein IKA22_14025, partial [Lentisphaeria bacterium]|nr:hypothetical protein [Lentisphaeria bacterium]
GYSLSTTLRLEYDLGKVIKGLNFTAAYTYSQSKSVMQNVLLHHVYLMMVGKLLMAGVSSGNIHGGGMVNFLFQMVIHGQKGLLKHIPDTIQISCRIL